MITSLIMTDLDMSKQYITVKVLLVSFLLFFSTTSVFAATKSIGILVYDDFLGGDVTAPMEVFGAASKNSWFSDYEVKLISIKQDKKVTTAEGLTLLATHTIFDENLDLDVLLLPSRYDMSALISDQELVTFIKEQAQKVEWLASNCSGAMLLGEAGVVDGYSITTWAGGESSLQSSYPNLNVVTDQNVVIDRNLISSNGSVVSYEAALVLLSKLSSEKKAKEIEDYIQLTRLTKTSLFN